MRQKVRFDWPLAMSRWAMGAGTAAVTGMAGMASGEMSMRSFWFVVAGGCLSAALVDLGAWQTARARSG